MAIEEKPKPEYNRMDRSTECSVIFEVQSASLHFLISQIYFPMDNFSSGKRVTANVLRQY